MLHNLTINAALYDSNKGYLITKQTKIGYEPGDSIAVTKEATREQRTVYVAEVVTENINGHYVLLILSDWKVAIDDVTDALDGRNGSDQITG